MSMFENEQYRWRETYFVLFDVPRRPTLAAVRKKIASLHDRLTLANETADDKGLVESLTVIAPDDFAALDISYLSGEEVLEQARTLSEDLRSPDLGPEDRARLRQLARFGARFDVLHFEQVTEDDQEPDEMLDPSALLLVLEALAELTGGVAIDPAAGAMI